MIISTDAKKSFDNIQHPFMIKKNSLESGYRGNIPQHHKGHDDRPTAVTILNIEKLKAFPLKSGTGQGCSLLLFLFNIVLEILAITIREEKEMKGSKLERKK